MDTPKDMETSYQNAIDQGKLNGAVVCATNATGSFSYKLTIGERTLMSGEKQPQQLDDVLYLASATKLITTIAALQCVEDGLLTLDGDLSSIAPELAAKQVLTGFSDDGKTPLFEPAARPITLEMLLTHTSGLVYEFLDPKVGKWSKEHAPAPKEGERRSVEKAFFHPLAFQPGTSWMYGPSLDWAGRIVERVAGVTLGAWMQQRIFTPLGITDAQFHPVTREDLRARMVDRNPNDPDGLGHAVVGGDASHNRRSEGDFGGQGLFMLAPDFLKVAQSLLANDGKLLKPASVDAMFEDHLNAQATKGHQAALDGPGGPFFLLGVERGTKVGHGLGGLLTLDDVPGWYGERTLSWAGGHTFAWFIDRKNDVCAACGLQSALPVDAGLVGRLKDVFRHDIYSKQAANSAQ